MTHESESASNRRVSRRHFLKKTGAITAVVAGADLLALPLSAVSANSGVSIVLEPSDELTKQPPVRWAAEELQTALSVRGVAATVVESFEQAPSSNFCVYAAQKPPLGVKRILGPGKIDLPAAPESFVLGQGKAAKNRAVLLAAGSDARGLVYALLELADRVACAANPVNELKAVKPTVESPANAIRSVNRIFASDVEDKPWFNDRSFWTRYLTMLAANRFNRVNLTFGLAYDFTTDITDCYFHFAYPFLLSVPGYAVRAVPLSDAERDSNLAMLHFISDEAARRRLQLQLGLWTHAYRWTNSPRANYTIEGLTPETQAPYSRDAVKLLLTQCPNITGVTLRTHGESGVAEGNAEIWKTIFSGIAQCGRKVEIDLHAKGIDQPIIDAAVATGLPVTVSPKFWAEHMGLPYMQGAIRAQEMPPPNAGDSGFFSRSAGSRSFLRYGYGDLLAKERKHTVLHRIWPGTQRVLLWGDPEIAAAYGRVAGFCGSNGVEILEPLSFKGRKGSGLPGGRNGYAEAALKLEFDFEKYEYSYRVWGRNLYNPDTDADGWKRLLRKEFAGGAEQAGLALSAAGKILPLVTTAHCPSAANNLYWPEMYWDMQMTEAGRRNPYSDTPAPRRFGTVSSLDPEFFLTCDELAEELAQGKSSGKYSPLWVAARLDECAEQAGAALRKPKPAAKPSPEFRRWQTDAAIQAGLGRFYAAKFRSGANYSLYLKTKEPAALREALREGQAARASWAELADAARGVYAADVTYGPDYYQRGHWTDRVDAMNEDLADLEKLVAQVPAPGVESAAWKKLKQAMQESAKGRLSWLSSEYTHKSLRDFHAPPALFHRGESLALSIQPSRLGLAGVVAGAQLRYRHVNQGEWWQEIEMQPASGKFTAAIPTTYTDSPFALQYHFRLRLAAGAAVLRPGLETRHEGQPYYVVGQA